MEIQQKEPAVLEGELTARGCVAPAACAALFLVAACSADSTNSSSDSASSAPAPPTAAPSLVLVDPRPVVIPDLSDETKWLGNIHELSVDPASGSLFARDVQSGSVTEFGWDGSHLVTYGGAQGRGPEEVARVSGFAFDDTLVALLDAGNAKLLTYTRGGKLRYTVPLAPNYRDVSVARGRIFLVPGADGGLVDVVDRDGTVRSLGSEDELPMRCEGADCSMLPLCTDCKVIGLADSLLVVVNIEESIMSTYSLTGEQLATFDFREEHPVVKTWHDQDLPLIESANQEGGGRIQMIKTYFISPQWIGGTKWGSAMTPSAEEFRERGYEYWIVDARNGSVQRYGYPRQRLGYPAVGAGPVFAVDRGDGGVYSLAIPEER